MVRLTPYAAFMALLSLSAAVPAPLLHAGDLVTREMAEAFNEAMAMPQKRQECAAPAAASSVMPGSGSSATTTSVAPPALSTENRTPGMKTKGGKGKKGNKGVASAEAAGKLKPKALYLITNQKPNEVLTVAVDDNGQLAMGNTFATGGNGAQGIDSKANFTAAGPDALFDQGAVAIAGTVLVAVNAGSNTLSMFTIDPTNPTQLTLVGQPVDTMGDFPNSVAINDVLNITCVANTGVKSGVACFTFDPVEGLKPLDGMFRPIPLGAGQTNPPVGPFNTISQILFDETASNLLVTVKGTPPPMNATAPTNSTSMRRRQAAPTTNSGFVSVFPIVNGTVSPTDIRSTPAGSLVLFGTLAIPGGDNTTFLASDASFGAGIIALNPADHTTSFTSTAMVAGQKATCWVAISPFTGTGFVTDVARNSLVEIDLTSGAIIRTVVDVGNGNPGMTDITAVGDMMYGLSPNGQKPRGAATVAVFDLSGGKGTAKATQNFNLGPTIGLEASGIRAFAA